MDRLRYWTIALGDLFLIVMPFIDVVNIATKVISSIGFIITTWMLIRKWKADIRNKQIDSDIKKVQLEQEQQRLYQLMEETRKLTR